VCTTIASDSRILPTGTGQSNVVLSRDMKRGREWENRAAQQCANSNVKRRIYPPKIITVCLFRFYC